MNKSNGLNRSSEKSNSSKNNSPSQKGNYINQEKYSACVITHFTKTGTENILIIVLKQTFFLEQFIVIFLTWPPIIENILIIVLKQTFFRSIYRYISHLHDYFPTLVKKYNCFFFLKALGSDCKCSYFPPVSSQESFNYLSNKEKQYQDKSHILGTLDPYSALAVLSTGSATKCCWMRAID